MPTYKIFFWSIFLWILMVLEGYAQTYQAESIRIKAGLPTDNVFQTVKNETGFLYVATRRGLCKYDGYHFYKSNHSTNNIASVTIDKNNVLYYYDVSKGLCSITDIVDTPTVISSTNYNDADPNNDHYEWLYVDKANRIWCADFTQVKFYTPDHSDSGTYTIDPKGKEIKRTSFMEMSNRDILVATNKGLFLWSEEGKSLQPFPDTTISQLNIVSALTVDANNILLATNDGTIVLYNVVNRKIVQRTKPLSGFSKKIVSLSRFNKKMVLIQTDNVLFSYNLNTGEISLLYKTERATINNLFYDNATAIIWVNSNRGIIKLQQKNEAIHILGLPTVFNGPQNVYSIVQDDTGNIWAAVSNRVIRYDKNYNWEVFELPEKAIVNSLYCYKNQLFACTNSGLYARKEKRFEKAIFNQNNVGLKKISFDKKGILWLLLADSHVRAIDYFTKGYKLPELLNDSVFWKDNKWNDIICDSTGSIWLAGWVPPGYGIARYDPSLDKFVEASSFPSNSNHDVFVGDYFNRVSQGINKSVLFSGYGGFNVLDSNGKVVMSIGAKEYKLASEIVQGISQTADGNIWFATAEGLNVWDSRSDKVRRITQTNGLPSDELLNGYCQLVENQLAMGYENGIVLVDQQKILASNFTNKLVLSAVEVNGNMMPAKTNVFILSNKENNIKLYFSSLSFTDKDKLVYRYKTEDEEAWTYLNEVPEIVLSHIAPGRYNITVEVGNILGDWQEKKILLHLLLRPPYYQTYWFKFLVASAAALCVFFAYRYLLSQQKAREQIHRKLKEAQMQALRTQMNPHFIFNSLNSINSFILDKKTDEASEYLTTFSRLMRTTLELTRKDTVRLSQEMEALRLYLEIESTRLEQGFDYAIQVQANVDVEGISIPPLILQPFVENAIWHGLRNKNTSGCIIVSIGMKNSSMLHVKIEDDGIGRKKSAGLKKNFKEHKSYGMEITLNRLQLHHPENALVIEDKELNNESAGTLVHLFIHI
jgi:ligand-binding sensor domain-containing protein